MIKRLVKLSISPESIEEFKRMFSERKDRISSFPGCRHLELWREASEGNIYFTYSHWESEADLEAYRHSEFFKETWQITKKMFSDRAEAWTLDSA